VIYLEEAIRVLLANKARTFLTTIGLIIGVFSVISILVLGHSMSGSINETLGSLADNSFTIIPDFSQRNTQRSQIRTTDIEDIKQTVPNIASGYPIGLQQEVVRYQHNIGRFTLFTDANPPFVNVPLAFGTNLSDDDINGALDVAVLNWRTYKRLFPDGGDPTGDSIYAGTHRYVIVGVQSEPRQGLLNVSLGGDVSIPYTTYVREYVQGNRVFAARFTVKDTSTMTQTEGAVMNRIRVFRQVDANTRYLARDKAQFTGIVGGIFNMITFVVGLIGAVSLLVAGIGVMNIMLVSIAERTREIGTRKAIGAQRGQILWQFFIEALLLSSIGCFIGMALGLLAGGAVNYLFIVKLTGYAASLPYLEAFIITTGFAVVNTLLFGLYPAFRAAALDPIEALRYE
jgi:putative ABC transport system permease protein